MSQKSSSTSTSEPIRARRARQYADQPKSPRLGKRKRESVLLLTRKGLKPEEIANVLQMSEDTVIAALKAPQKGRPPSHISDADLAKVEQLAGLGLSKEDIASVIGMSRQTFYTHEKNNPFVEQALETGKAKAKGLVANSLLTMAKTGNVTAIIWWEKTRAGYSDTLILEKKVKTEMSAVMEFLKGELDADTFDAILWKYNNEFCSGGLVEEEDAPEAYR